jgi:hypothetical protein
MFPSNFSAISSRLNLLKRIAKSRATQLHGAVPTLGAQEAAHGQAETIEVDHATPLSGMLFAAIVAALMVVAEQLISTWADGHLLVVWVSLWMVVFAALALMTPSLRQIVTGLTAPHRFSGRDHTVQPPSQKLNTPHRSSVTQSNHEINRGKNDE